MTGARGWVLAVLIACDRKPDAASQRADASVTDAATAASASTSVDAAPGPPREPGTWSVDCGQSSDAPIAAGSMRLPARYVFERPDIDAIVHDGTPTYVTEGWKVDPKEGCEHQYQVRLKGANARARFEELAKRLDVKPEISGMRYRLYADKPKEGIPFFVMVEPVGGDNVSVNILHRGVDVPACMRRAVEALQPSLRPTTGLTASGAQARYASIVRDEGTQPWCQVDYEWFYDTKIYPKVRSWIESRGHKIDKNKRFGWDDGADGSMTEWSVHFGTPRKSSEP